MAKRSQRRPARSENDQLGCMWGLISIFDFRHGRLTRKLLPDKRRGSNRHTAGIGFSRSRLDLLTDHDDKCQSIDDSSESKARKVDNGRTCVKKLIEEDMPGKQHREKQKISCSAAVEEIPVQSDSKHRGKLGKKIHKQRNKTGKAPKDHVEHGVHDDSIASTCLESLQESCRQNSVVERSSQNLDLAAVMEELCSQFHEMNLHHTGVGNREEGSCYLQKLIRSVKQHNQLNELYTQLALKHSILREKLSEGTDEVFLNQKFIDDDVEQLACDSGGAIRDSNRFMDALHILNSNKELFLKLLEDQNMLSWKHMQEGVPQDSQVEEEVKPSKSVVGMVKLSDEEIDKSRQNDEDEKQLFRQKQFQKQKHMHNYFFRRKVKSEGGHGNGKGNPSTGGSDNSQFSNRIVILKPSSSVGNSIQTSAAQHSLRNERLIRSANSHFSFTEFKRKLKNAMGESRNVDHLIPMGGSILHNRIPSKHRQGLGNEGKGETSGGYAFGEDFSTKTHDRRAKPSNFDNRGKRSDKPTDFQSEAGNEVASTSTNDDTCENLTRTTVDPKQRESEIYEEAKKHLVEMLSTEDEDDDDLSSRKFPRTVPRSLGKILSLPENKCNLSPIFSPGRDQEHCSVNGQMKNFPHDDFQNNSENRWQLKLENNATHTGPLEQNLRTPLFAFGSSPVVKLLDLDSDSDTSKKLHSHMNVQESVFSIRGDSSLKGNVDIVEIIDNAYSEENTLFSDLITSTPATISSQTLDKIVVCEEQGYSEHSRREDPLKENQTPSGSSGSFSLSYSLIHKVKALDNGSEGPSPISVLEPHFLEDVTTSHASTTLQPAEMPKQPVQIHFEEQDSSPTVVVQISDPDIYLRSLKEEKIPTFEYIRAVLQASGLLYWGIEEHMEKYHSSSEQQQLLDPSLLDEVEVVHDQLCSDRGLLFDCLNELLLEVYERYFGCSPWVSYIKPSSRPVPVGNHIVREVWKGLDWHFGPQLPPLQHTATLDQMVGKDLAKAGGAWMDLRFNSEAISIEMTEIILEDLMQEIAFEFCTC